MRCYNCGFENPENANFCQNCGVSLKFLLLPEKRIVAVMFADLVNFTKISEHRDPEDVLNLLNTLFTRIEKIVIKHDGTIDKFLGDGVMILFGTPIAHEDDVERALYCAEEILLEVKNLREFLNEDVKIKISINVGPVICGFSGGAYKRMYTVIGDVVNVAEKINDFARPNTIIVTERVIEYTSHIFDFKKLGNMKVPGKEEQINIYELTGSRPRDIIYSSFKGKLIPLVGRKEEFNKIIRSLSDSVSGSGRAVVLIGEAGVGKSRMKYEVKKYCRENIDVFIIEADCKSQYKDSPFQPIIDILSQIFNIEAGDSIEVKKGKIKIVAEKYGIDEEILKPIKNLFGVNFDSGTEIKLGLDEAFVSLLNILSQFKPIFIIVEDIQWIDESSIEILRNLLKKLNDMRIFLLLTYRPLINILLPDFPYLEPITLYNLSKSETLSMIAELLEVDDVPQNLVELVYRKTEGNPLFIEELVERLYKDKVFEITERGEIVFIKNLEEISIPDKITSLFLQEIDRLPPPTKNVVKVASVIGRDFNREILENLVQVEDLEYHLRILEESGLVFRDREKLNKYLFKHSFVRDAVYGLLPKKELKELHFRVASTIEALYSTNLQDYYEMLAYHYEVAEKFDKAFTYNIQTGKNYLKSGMLYAARSKFKKSEEIMEKHLKLVKARFDENELADLYINLASVSLGLGFLKEAKNYSTIAKEIAIKIKDLQKLRDSLELSIKINSMIFDLEALRSDIEMEKNYFKKDYLSNFESLLKFTLMKSESKSNDLEAVLNDIRPVPYNLKVAMLKFLIEKVKYSYDREHLKSLLKFLDELSSHIEEPFYWDILMMKTHVLVFSGRHNEAELLISKIKDEFSTKLSDYNHAQLYIQEAILKREQGEFAECQQLLTVVRRMSEDLNHVLLKANALFEMARTSFFYLNEYIEALKYFSGAIDNYTLGGELQNREISKMLAWLGNLILGNLMSYNQLPEQFIPSEIEANELLSINYKTVYVITELLSGDFENAIKQLSSINFKLLESEILVGLAYVILIFLMVKDHEVLEGILERIIFVLSKRNSKIFDTAHYNVIYYFYNGIIKTPGMSSDGEVFKNIKSQNANLIRETRILSDMIIFFYDNSITEEEKFFYFEDLLTQAMILKSAFLILLIKLVEYKVSSDHEVSKQILSEIKQILKTFKFDNVLKLIGT